MKAIEQLISTSKPQQHTLPQNRASLQSYPHGDDPGMHLNVAYEPVAISTKGRQLPAEPTSSLATGKAELKPVLDDQRSSNLQDDPGYYYVKDAVKSCSPPNHGKGDTKTAITSQLVSTGNVRDDNYNQMQQSGGLHTTSSDPSLSSSESPVIVAKTLKRLSRFNSDQMEHLIEMLKTTFVSLPQNDKSIPEQAAVSQSVTPPPRPPKPTNCNISASSSARERPSQLSLTMSKNGCSHHQPQNNNGSPEQPPYVNTLPATANKEESGNGREKERESVTILVVEPNDEDSAPPVHCRSTTDGDQLQPQNHNGNHTCSHYGNTLPAAGEDVNGTCGEKEILNEGVSVPSLVVEPTDEDSAPPVQHKKSVGLLTTAETANALKFKLGT